jgi:hypothetical protein
MVYSGQVPLVKVTRAVQVFREGDKFGVYSSLAEGSVEIPEYATWALDGGNVVPGSFSWTWVEADHCIELQCPRCASEASCLQHLEVWVGAGTIMITHEYDREGMN